MLFLFVGSQLCARASFLILLGIMGCSHKNEFKEHKDENPVTWIAEYKGWACGGLTSQVMPVDRVSPSVSLKNIEYGLVFHIPEGMKSPDGDYEFEVPGNRFELKGYYYYQLVSGKKVLTPRFDLIGWRILAPYKVYDNQGKAIEITKPFEDFWEFPLHSKTEFKLAHKYENGCL